jgi:hypothetical protein
MRNMDVMVRNGTETAGNSMNDTIEESIQQIEVLCFLFLFGFLSSTASTIMQRYNRISNISHSCRGAPHTPPHRRVNTRRRRR